MRGNPGHARLPAIQPLDAGFRLAPGPLEDAVAALALAFHWQPSEIKALPVGRLRRHRRRANLWLRGEGGAIGASQSAQGSARTIAVHRIIAPIGTAKAYQMTPVTTASRKPSKGSEQSMAKSQNGSKIQWADRQNEGFRGPATGKF